MVESLKIKKIPKFVKCAPFWPQAQNVAVAHCFYLPFWSKSPNLVKIPKFSENDQNDVNFTKMGENHLILVNFIKFQQIW